LGILEEIAADEGMSAPRFISTLHREILLLRGEVPNFASHLRCICVIARTSARRGGEARAEAA
jgi:predicted DNA-binding ribbon-helix-helix protein